MARKAKKRVHQMPRLSFADKLIYWMIMLIFIAFYIALFAIPLCLREAVAFADETVMAKTDHASFLWSLPGWMTFFLMTFIIWTNLYQKRLPIFGLRNFKYGPPAWPKIYPLFMKNKPKVWVSERAKKERKQGAVLLIIVLLISFIPYPWSIYGRDCLQHDGGIKEYNMFNVCTQEYTSGQIQSVEFEAYKSWSKNGSRRGRVKVTLTTDDGRRYRFDSHEFQSFLLGDDRSWPEEMLQLKRRYSPEIISYRGTNNVEFVITRSNLTAQEAEMLHQLFGIQN